MPELRRAAVPFFFFFGIAFLPAALAADGDASSLTAKIERLEKKLAAIEATQSKIVEKQEQILKELDTLRVWVRRN